MSSRLTFWSNDRKTEAKHPDARGHVEISCALVQELAAAMAAGQGMTQNIKGEWVFQLDSAAWRGTSPEPRMPVITGQISSLAETQEQARKLAEWKARQGQQNGGGNAFWGPPAQQQSPAAPPQQDMTQWPMTAPQAAPAAAPQPSAPPAPAAPAPAPAAAPAAAPGGWGAPAPAGGGWGQAPGI
jgi:hypothetical protein